MYLPLQAHNEGLKLPRLLSPLIFLCNRSLRNDYDCLKPPTNDFPCTVAQGIVLFRSLHVVDETPSVVDQDVSCHVELKYCHSLQPAQLFSAALMIACCRRHPTRSREISWGHRCLLIQAQLSAYRYATQIWQRAHTFETDGIG